MSKSRNIYLLMIAVLLTALHGAHAQTDGAVNFRVTTSNPGHKYDPKHVMAIWVTDSSGTFVKSLKVRAATREQYLYQWIADSSHSKVDAVTGATLSSHQTHNVVWDCRNTSGAIVPDAAYRIRVELTGKNAQGLYTPVDYISFTKGTSPVSLTPANNQVFSNMLLDYTPDVGSVTPDVAVLNIDPPLGTRNSTVGIQVAVTNKTTQAESFTVTLTDVTSAQQIGTGNVTDLAGNSSTIVAINWNTSGLPSGQYTLRAEAGPMVGETTVSDNTLTDTILLRNARHDVAIQSVDFDHLMRNPGETTGADVWVSNMGDFTESSVLVRATDLTENGLLASQTISSITPAQASKAVLAWGTVGWSLGYHDILIEVVPVSGETLTDDNTLIGNLAMATGTETTAFVQTASGWKYNDTGADLHASNWKLTTYYDGLWGSGPGPLGYGDGQPTIISYGPDSDNKYPCYYFRREFIADRLPLSLTLNLMRDDGAVVYLNGAEIARDNMVAGPTVYNQYASGTVSSGDEDTYFVFSVDPSLMVLGRNVLAAEVHQVSASSSDLSFDAVLEALTPQIPVVRDRVVNSVQVAGSATVGDQVDVVVQVGNNGNSTEAFSVTLTDTTAGPQVGSMAVDELAPGSTQTLRFPWSTVGAATGTHTFEAEIATVAGETNILNNIASGDGTVGSFSIVQGASKAVSAIGGFCAAVAVAPPYAYLGAGDSLVVVDVSNAATPVKAGSLHLPGMIEDVAVSGSLLFAACGESGVHIVDVSTPSAPAYVNTFDSSGHAFGVAVSGGTLYLADGVSGLRIINVSSPASPSLLGSFITKGPARDVAISGSTVYLLDNYNGLLILNAASPASPTLLGSYGLIAFGQKLALSGSLAYVVDGGGTVSAINVGSPATPTLAGSERVGPPGGGVAVSGTSLFAANGAAGVRILNSSTAALQSTVDTDGTSADVAVDSGNLYVADGFNGLEKFNAASSAALGSYHGTTRGRHTVVNDGVAYVASGNQGVRIFSVADPASPALLATASSSTNARGVAVSSNLLFVADGQYGLEIVDVSTPAAPSHAGRYASSTYGSIRCVGAVGSMAYITDGRSVMQINAATPGSPGLQATYAAPDYVYDLEADGATVLLAAGRAGLIVLDAVGVGYQGGIALPGISTGVSVDGTTAYVASGIGGWHVVDISNPASPSLIRTYTGQGVIRDIAAGNSTAMALGADRDLVGYDVSTPLTPVAVTNFAPLVRAMQVTVGGAYTYASSDDAGVSIFALPADFTDADEDGMDDSIEQQIVDADPGDGITSIYDVDPDADFDGDGLSNLHEQIAGTSPTDRASVFALSGVQENPGGAGYAVSWYSVSGRTYTIHKTTNLMDGFTELQPGISATAPLNTFIDPDSESVAMYMITIDP
ncbi:MAG: DUF2271 domain-containing protein [Kiritimatiellales bacterium]|nr:DUF2271 domain-containing protein [Kiritimatiellales bacterium]